MELTAEEKAMLAGAEGEAVRRALAYQIEVGRFFGAERFVPITNAHMMGDIEVLGDAGLAFLRDARRCGARARIPVTTNARCVDFAWADRLGQDPGECAKEREVIAALQAMDVVTADTCINYQTLYQPHLGERVAWGDTGTVIYANSVFGARSNFESGPAALAAAHHRPHAGIRLPARPAPQGPLRGGPLGRDARRPRRLGRAGQDRRRAAPELLRGAGLHRLPAHAARRRAEAARLRARLLRLHGHVPHGGRDAGSALGGGGARRRGAVGALRRVRRRHRGGLPRLPARRGRLLARGVLRAAALLVRGEDPGRAVRRAAAPSRHAGLRHHLQRRAERRARGWATSSRWRRPASRCWKACASTSCRTSPACGSGTAGAT